MAFTLLESAKRSKETLKTAVAKIIHENSPVLDRLEMTPVQGNAYTYRKEHSLPSVAFRAIGGTYTANTGVINPVTETVTILGGEILIDNFLVKTQGNIVDVKSREYRLKARAAAIAFNTAFFEGDSNTDANSFDGLRKRITGNQLILNAAGGGALTLDNLDKLIDAVPFDDKVLYMNRTLRRKVTALVRAAGSGHGYTVDDVDKYGKQVTKYNGVPILIVERMDDASTILDFDEDPGDGTSDCASIYCISFGEDRVHGLLGAGGSWEVKDFGEVTSSPGHLGRIELYPGMAVEHGRSVARLYGVTNA